MIAVATSALLFLVMASGPRPAGGFAVPAGSTAPSILRSSSTRLSARRSGGGRRSGDSGGGRVLRPAASAAASSPTAAKKKKRGGGGNNKKRPLTLEQLADRIASDPAAAAALTGGGAPAKGKKAGSARARTRRKVERPRQTYVYASQRSRMERDGPAAPSTNDGASENGGAEDDDVGDVEASAPVSPQRQRTYRSLEFARSLGLAPATQSCFPVLGDFEGSEPRVVGEVRVVEDDDLDLDDDGDEGGEAGGGKKAATSGTFAYVIDKPAGWSILGDGGRKNKRRRAVAAAAVVAAPSARGAEDGADASKNPGAARLDFYDDDPRPEDVGGDDNGGDETLELEEADLLAVMTPEERAEFEAEGGLDTTAPGASSPPAPEEAIANHDEVSRGAGGGLSEGAGGDQLLGRRRRISGYDEDGAEGVVDFDETDFLAALTPEERADFAEEGGFESLLGIKGGTGGGGGGAAGGNTEAGANNKGQGKAAATTDTDGAETETEEVFEPQTRPSVVSWLKSLKAAEGTPIRGGKYWKAVAGAAAVDDSGLVVLCPKDRTANLHIDYATYVAAVGNGRKVAPKKSVKKQGGGATRSTFTTEEAEIDVVARLRRHRGDDPVTVAALSLPDGTSTCDDAAALCQSEFSDGVRGDPAADPIERRAPRRLVHCGALSVSSLVSDDDVEVMTDPLPDDLSNLAERKDGQEYARGAYLGRQAELRNDGLTTAYREINGAGDGYPGWIVDRYDKWVLVQHDPSLPRGPLPSIHDGNTLGVYYYPTDPDRSAISDVKPELIEGQPAPEEFPVVENGITYRVRLGESFSTGLFLDQRPQRAWLARHCTPNTRVLNCFAHCGAFSVAAATAGASTVSLDLDKKWLDRIRPQMEDNGVEDSEGRHDCIYGDCFDWLSRLGKRGEKYDIVILDPPSTSVGGRKKRRWSLRNDMDELVALAAPLVRSGGLLWTTTNAAGVPADKFAKMCRRGLEDAGLGDGARLERVAPMPGDFPCVGAPPVKNLVWRIP